MSLNLSDPNSIRNSILKVEQAIQRKAFLVDLESELD